MNIKDYLPFYLGCDVLRPDGRTILKMIGISGTIIEFENPLGQEEMYGDAKKAKPILRPLSDMTDDEIIEIAANIFLVTPHLIEFSLEEIKTFIVKNEMFVVGAAEDEYEENSVSVLGYEFSPTSFFLLTQFLLSKHFDLFGLIEAGLAIDKTKL
jgi:hypothetical protein